MRLRRRLDVEMVRRGLTASRSEAALAIRLGRVVVSGSPAMKAGTMVRPDEAITMAAAARRYVSRGGEKLEAALDRFGIEVKGLRALDAGASTGGFTDCLLSRGAEHVVTVDVGYGQLDWRLREDPRVTVLERVNVRELEPDSLPYRPDVIAADLSFISLRLVIPALVRCAASGALFILLVKPQFEAGKDEVGGGGVVRDPDVWRRVLADVAEASRREELEVGGAMASPLVGPAGNIEFLMYARRVEKDSPFDGQARAETTSPRLEAAIEEGLALAPDSGREAGEAEGAGA
ncbi:MAG TPA: TlyA family RNA methyltransferase [Actinomycetota bacterium]